MSVAFLKINCASKMYNVRVALGRVARADTIGSEKMKQYIVLGMVMIFAASCGSGTSPSELWEAQGTWELQAIGSTSIPDPESYTVRFSEDGRAQVRADCNSCFGGYETDGNAITIGPLSCSRVFCGDDSFFNQYVASLSGASAFVRRGDTLELTHSGGDLSFRVAR